MQVRKHIGLLVPSANSTVEPDFYMAMPSDVTVHSQHIWSEIDPRRPARTETLGEEMLQAARYLTPIKLSAICLPQGNGALEEQFGRIFNLPAIASSPSVLQALRAYGIKRIAIATPFDEWVNSRLSAFFATFGFQVLSAESHPAMQKSPPPDTNLQEPSEIVDFAISACHAEAEAIILSGSAWRAMEAAEEIERRTGKLVVTSNQATIWRTLQTVGAAEGRRGYGRLLSEIPAAEGATVQDERARSVPSVDLQRTRPSVPAIPTGIPSLKPAAV